MGNTKVEYMYRDGSNYKIRQSVVLRGTLTKKEIDQIFSKLDGIWFIPRQVGLPEERFEESNEDDHCYFEMQEITDTNEGVDEVLTAKEMYANFMAVKEWDCVKYAYPA